MPEARASVILNSYNQSRYLAQAIESVLAQTMPDFELLIVDNGSTDDSVQVATSFADDSRVRLLAFEGNEPIGRRFNQAIAAATSDFVGFLYSDDLLLPHKLAAQLAAFEHHPDDYGVVYAPSRRLNELTGEEWTAPSIAASGQVLADLLRHHRRGQIDMVSPLTRRAALLAEPFNDDVFAEGEGIFLRLALRWRFAYSPEPVAVLRDHADNAGRALARNHDMTMVGVARLADHPALAEEARPLVREYRRNLLVDYGWQAVRLDGDVAWGRRRLLEAVRDRPSAKAVAGLLLSLLPARARHAINRLGHRARGAKGNRSLVADYEGLS